MWVIIPVLALLIPISAIVLNSAVGKAIADTIRSRNRTLDSTGGPDLRTLEHRILKLEQESREAGDKLLKLGEENDFFRRLIGNK